MALRGRAGARRVRCIRGLRALWAPIRDCPRSGEPWTGTGTCGAQTPGDCRCRPSHAPATGTGASSGLVGYWGRWRRVPASAGARHLKVRRHLLLRVLRRRASWTRSTQDRRRVHRSRALPPPSPPCARPSHPARPTRRSHTFPPPRSRPCVRLRAQAPTFFKAWGGGGPTARPPPRRRPPDRPSLPPSPPSPPSSPPPPSPPPSPPPAARRCLS